MAHQAFILSTPPDWLMELLGEHRPHCVPLFLRLRSAKVDAATTPHARILFVSQVRDLAALESGSLKPQGFAAAYVDFARGPQTEMFMYSSVERGQQQQQAEDLHTDEYAREQLRALRDGVGRIREEYAGETAFGNRALLGTVHTSVRRVFEQLGCVQPRLFGFWDKWLIKPEELPPLDESLPEGMHWSKATQGDGHVMVARTEIPRIADELLRLPSLVIKLQDETPIAWASLGTDGSLINLYCEEAYRRRGLARKLAIKILHDNKARYQNGACMSLDVAAKNHPTRSLCKALNGKPHWEVSWVYLLLGSS